MSFLNSTKDSSSLSRIWTFRMLSWRIVRGDDSWTLSFAITLSVRAVWNTNLSTLCICCNFQIIIRDCHSFASRSLSVVKMKKKSRNWSWNSTVFALPSAIRHRNIKLADCKLSNDECPKKSKSRRRRRESFTRVKKEKILQKWKCQA